MSIIYSGITSLINRISDEFHKSFLFTFIFTILAFIEKQWVNSYFKGFYPNENFLGFLNKNQILKNHIFNPLIVLFLFALFLLLSLNNPSNSLVMTLLLAFAGFFIGSTLLSRYFLNNNLDNIVHFKRHDIYSIGFCLMLDKHSIFLYQHCFCWRNSTFKTFNQVLIKTYLHHASIFNHTCNMFNCKRLS